jgi:hypothetical protein
MLTQIHERHALPQPVTRRIGGGLGTNDLAPVCDRHQPSGSVQRRSEVIPGPTLCRSRVQPHPYLQATRVSPVLTGEATLSRDGGLDAVLCGPKHGVDTVTRGLYNGAALRFDRVPQDLVMAS